ncbi:MAG: response regulator transcription factor [Rhodospirillales bacterium]|nr:response regulator transcription factor [Rhodospirillales bacterium]MCW8861923.1 response regulator transcription factor [Rhodospirillales bacterium]MCW8951224.1 response regulator transcription factor [Rhodospirillales bacterium]MCW9003532.1 response regulator transcription factor [Rhodospirillales bacterium]
MESDRILVVEDETLIRQLLAEQLRQAGYTVIEAPDAATALSRLEKESISLMLLDLVLPDEDGLVLLRKARALSDVPSIILSARDDRSSRLAGLELGADDYLHKGIDRDELLLRIRNVLSRYRAPNGRGEDGGRIIRFEGWALDLDGHELRDPQGGAVSLTGAELRLLAALARGSGRVLSRNHLIDAISGFDTAPSERTIDSFISRLRKKIGDDPRRPRKILTVTGAGYKFAVQVEK